MTKDRFELIAKILIHEAERVQVVSLESEVDQFWEDYDDVLRLIHPMAHITVDVHCVPDLINPKLPIFFTSGDAWQFFRGRVQNGLDATNREADKHQKKYIEEKSLAKKLSDILEVTA